VFRHVQVGDHGIEALLPDRVQAFDPVARRSDHAPLAGERASDRLTDGRVVVDNQD